MQHIPKCPEHSRICVVLTQRKVSWVNVSWLWTSSL